MWTWSRKIILSFWVISVFTPMGQNFSLGTTKLFNWRLWGFKNVD